MSSVNKIVKIPPISETVEMSPVNGNVDLTLQRQRIIQKSKAAYKEQQKGGTTSILINPKNTFSAQTFYKIKSASAHQMPKGYKLVPGNKFQGIISQSN